MSKPSTGNEAWDAVADSLGRVLSIILLVAFALAFLYFFRVGLETLF